MAELKRRFSLSSVVTVALLVGFVGFGLGFNWTSVENLWQNRFSRTSKELPENLDFSSVESVYDVLRQNFAGGELDAQKLLEGAKAGLVKSTGDPNTAYLDEAASKEFQEGLSGTFSGIGAEIAIKNERLVIVAPLSGSPAKAADLQAGDYITEINGESTADMTVETAVSKIRGPAGTEVKLRILRGNDPSKEVTIKRAVIEVPAVKAELKPGNIGYIELSRFGEDAADKLQAAAQQLRSQGAQKIILDLRNNPGGLLDQAVKVADEFLDDNKVIVEERRDSKVLSTERSKAGGSLVGMPVVVLVNEGSASASEIIAGALQDNKTATVIGEQTFGKGSVQEIVELDGKSVLKVTVALWYTPGGKNITKEGITPDVKVELTDDDFNNDRDPQLQKALELMQAG